MSSYGGKQHNTWNVGSPKRLILVKELYDKYGTLQLVADQMGITRERVRQLLKAGQRKHLYLYKLTRNKKFEELLAKVSREKLIEVLSRDNNLKSICKKLDVSERDYYKLLNNYQMSPHDYATDVRRKRCLDEYTKIVDKIGHHPTTTEMIKIPLWRALWVRIDRYWGSIDAFRSEYGIEKPKQFIHPNTIKAWSIAVEKNKLRKQMKVDNVFDYFKTHKISKIILIADALGYTRVSTHNYVKYLLEIGKIARIGSGVNTKYRLL